MSKNKIMVNPNRPLPPELGKEYWETTAKMVLEYFFPERFVGLSVGGESPDLCNENTGIEVTSAEDSKSQEIDSLYSRQFAYGNDRQKKKALKRIEELGGRVEDFFLSHPSRHRDLGRVYKVIRLKTHKLNKNYKIFNKNYLFIYDTNLIFDQELQKMLLTMIECSAEYEIKFDSVFLCHFGGDLYEFNLENKSCFCINDSGRVVQQLAMDARKIIDNKYAK